MLDRPSQHSSLSGMRTVLAFQSAIALTEASSTGPSKMPYPWTHMNSPPERLTPSSRRVVPPASTSLFPETCSSGAVPVVGGGSVGVGDGSVSTLHVVPLSLNVVGTALLPDHEARNPALTLAPEPSAPFQLSLAAVTVVAD